MRPCDREHLPNTSQRHLAITSPPTESAALGRFAYLRAATGAWPPALALGPSGLALEPPASCPEDHRLSPPERAMPPTFLFSTVTLGHHHFARDTTTGTPRHYGIASPREHIISYSQTQRGATASHAVAGYHEFSSYHERVASRDSTASWPPDAGLRGHLPGPLRPAVLSPRSVLPV